MKFHSPASDLGQEAFAFLQNIPLFEGLDEAAQVDIASRMQYRTFGVGMTLFHQDMPGMTLYMLA